MSTRSRGGAWSALLLTIALGGCDPSGGSSSEPAVRKAIDETLEVHAVAPSTPTAEGLAYLQAVSDLHARADAVQGELRIRVLRQGLAVPVPAGLGEAELLRLDLAARLAEELLARPQGARAARDLLTPMLTPDRSLPLDRASARALIVLGDAAVETGDDALAAGSYWRSIQVMSLLRQELEP